MLAELTNKYIYSDGLKKNIVVFSKTENILKSEQILNILWWFLFRFALEFSNDVLNSFDKRHLKFFFCLKKNIAVIMDHNNGM